MTRIFVKLALLFLLKPLIMQIRLPLLFILLATLSMLSAQTDFSSNLPIIIIDTEGDNIPDEPKVRASMKIIDNGPGQLNATIDDPAGYNGFIGIERRGSTSQTVFPKVGYGIETRDADGEDLNVSLLGFPEEEDWVLHGPYSDKSLIRNALAYHLAGQIMDYAPRIRLTELIIDGEYQGIYLFTERIKRDKNRVDISKLTPDENTGDDLTGGYILKLDKFTGETDDFPVQFTSRFNADTESEQTIRFLYHYPKPEDISANQRVYIENWMNRFEDALAGDQFLDSLNGYRQYVDLPSFVDFLIINEISRNVDGYRLSSYFSKDKDSKGGKLMMGPVWDFNLAFGNANYCGGAAARGWGYDFGINCPDDFWQLPFWWDRLREDPIFLDLLNDRWKSLRRNLFSDERLNGTIDSLVAEMGNAVDRNFNRWPVIGEAIWPNVFVGDTYEAEVVYLKNWLTERTNWMDGAIQTLTSTESALSFTPLQLSPNPTSGILKLSGLPTEQLEELRLYDLTGKLLKRLHRLSAAEQINLGQQVPGMYIVQARTAEGQVFTGRVLWQ